MHNVTSVPAPVTTDPRREAAVAVFAFALASIYRTSITPFDAVERVVNAVRGMIGAALFEARMDVGDAVRALGFLDALWSWRANTHASDVRWRDAVRLHEILHHIEKNYFDGGWAADLVHETVNLDMEEVPENVQQQAEALAVAFVGFADHYGITDIRMSLSHLQREVGRCRAVGVDHDLFTLERMIADAVGEPPIAEAAE